MKSHEMTGPVVKPLSPDNNTRKILELRSMVEDLREEIDRKVEKEVLRLFNQRAGFSPEPTGAQFYKPKDIWCHDLELDIAEEDYWEIVDGEKKTLFTWDEAMAIADKVGDYWRLPTRHEWVLICEKFALDDSGELSPEKLQSELGLVAIADDEGYYWSSTEYSYTYGRHLYFDSEHVNPQDYNYKDVGFSVRLVRRSI